MTISLNLGIVSFLLLVFVAVVVSLLAWDPAVFR